MINIENRNWNVRNNMIVIRININELNLTMRKQRFFNYILKTK